MPEYSPAAGKEMKHDFRGRGCVASIRHISYTEETKFDFTFRIKTLKSKEWGDKGK